MKQTAKVMIIVSLSFPRWRHQWSVHNHSQQKMITREVDEIDLQKQQGISLKNYTMKQNIQKQINNIKPEKKLCRKCTYLTEKPVYLLGLSALRSLSSVFFGGSRL